MEKIRGGEIMNYQQPKCTTVMYHYVRNMHETNYPNIKGLLIKRFIGQLNYILRNYKVIRLEDYIEFLHGNKSIPNNSCILTFDDGFKDHYLNVFPILKREKLAASFFPITQPLTEFVVPAVHKTHFLLAKIDSRTFADAFNQAVKSSFPELVERYFVDDNVKKERKYRWDDQLTSNLKYNIATMPLKPKVEILNQIFARYFENEKEFCRELYMSIEEMIEMIEEGMSFGGHTHTHPMLSRLTQEEQIKELKGSKEILEKNLKAKVELFSYPYGSFNETTINILTNNRYICGVTTDVGINEGGNIDPFTIKRLDTNDLPFDEGGCE